MTCARQGRGQGVMAVLELVVESGAGGQRACVFRWIPLDCVACGARDPMTLQSMLYTTQPTPGTIHQTS